MSVYVYLCSACGDEITAARPGLLHAIEQMRTHPDMTGFAFYAWNEDAAALSDFGHVHNDACCIRIQVDFYLQTYRWGRIARRDHSRIIGKATIWPDTSSN